MNFPHIDPVFLRLGPLEFRWYGLMYILSFTVAYFVIRSTVRRYKLPLTNDDVADMIFTTAVGIILGGRCGYILFYNLSYYLANPLKVFAVWEGGMSFHGGLLGGIAGLLIFSRKKEIPFIRLADIAALTAPIGLGFGRLGNFINGELYGRVTDVSWGVVFPNGGPLPRHPSQLYEAFLEGLVTFAILWIVSRRQRPAGVIAWLFISLYGLFRFSVEFVREPDTQLGFLMGGLSMGQLLSLPMLALGIGLIIWSYAKERRG